ncbi:hypothetical protein BH10PSE17_BH10PSE17_31610 [soil metagenome]
MLRILLLAIALLMPTQFAWAGMTASCQHETDPVKAQHIGHHEHHHQGDPRPLSGGKSTVGDSCGACHGFVMPLLSVAQAVPLASMTVARLPLQADAALPAGPARVPDRPQWLRLA